jgi:hypothetical protein
MEMPQQWRRKDLNELTLDQITSTEFWGVINTILGNLTGALTNLRYPSLFDLNEVMYLLFNSEELGPFYAQQRKDKAREAAGELESLDDAVTLKQGPLPGHIHLGFDYARCNSTFHSSVIPTEFESAEYLAGYLDDLFGQPYPFVYSHYVQTLPYRKGMRGTRRKVQGTSFLRGLLGRTNRELHPEDEEAEVNAQHQHLGLFYSKSRATTSRIQVTVQAPTYEDVRSRAQLMMGSMSNNDMLSVTVLDEETQLAPLLAHICLIDE